MVWLKGYRFSERSYSSYTRLLLSGGMPGTLGETKTGGFLPCAAKSLAT